MSILNVQRRRRSSLAAAIFIATAVRAFSADTSRIRVVAIMVSCFVLTTLGYGGAAWTVARAVVLGAK